MLWGGIFDALTNFGIGPTAADPRTTSKVLIEEKRGAPDLTKTAKWHMADGAKLGTISESTCASSRWPKCLEPMPSAWTTRASQNTARSPCSLDPRSCDQRLKSANGRCPLEDDMKGRFGDCHISADGRDWHHSLQPEPSYRCCVLTWVATTLSLSFGVVTHGHAAMLTEPKKQTLACCSTSVIFVGSRAITFQISHRASAPSFHRPGSVSCLGSAYTK